MCCPHNISCMPWLVPCVSHAMYHAARRPYDVSRRVLPTPCFVPPTARAMCCATHRTTYHAAGYWACAQNAQIQVRSCQRQARHWLVWTVWHHCRPKKKRKEKKRKEKKRKEKKRKEKKRVPLHLSWHVMSRHITLLLMPVHSCGGDWDLYTQLVSKEHKQVTYLSLSGHRWDDVGKNEWGES